MANTLKTSLEITSLDAENSPSQANIRPDLSPIISEREVQMDGFPEDVSSKSNYEGQKVNRKHLSGLMKFILVNTGDGADRGEIFSNYYGLERRYCGYFTDPCMKKNELREYERLYHDKQPVFSKALKRLEEKGLVSLIRHGSYVKRIQLTAEGKLIAKELTETYSEKV
jgi:DNA-binding transcriptional ArsR family regulator